MLIANIQNICNLIGREKCNIGSIVLSISTLCSLTKNPKTFDFNSAKKFYWIKINQWLITNY